VPTGSLQNEKRGEFQHAGRRSYLRRYEQPVAIGRLRPVWSCLVDLPTYFANVQGPGNFRISDVSPAIKWQVSPRPGKVDLSVVFGVALPTGSVVIAGRGAQPYLQFPWSWELHDGWGVSGMFTEFFRPSDFKTKNITETTSCWKRS